MISMSKEPAHDMVADMELEAEMPAPPVFAPFGGLLGCPMSFSSDSSANRQYCRISEAQRRAVCQQAF